MKSTHIDNRKLYEVVNEGVVLSEPELEHLATCDECLEMVRLLVRQHLPRNADS